MDFSPSKDLIFNSDSRMSLTVIVLFFTLDYLNENKYINSIVLSSLNFGLFWLYFYYIYKNIWTDIDTNTLENVYFTCVSIGILAYIWFGTISRVNKQIENKQMKNILNESTMLIVVVPILVILYNILRGKDISKSSKFSGINEKLLANIVVLFTFAGLYKSLHNIDSKTFNFGSHDNFGSENYMSYIYYSAITHTTIGFGDFSANNSTGMAAILLHALLVLFINFVG